MATIKSREDLKQYSLRALGHPVVKINVANEQLEDRIDEALEFFYLYHHDGIQRLYLKHQITQQNIDTMSVDIPENIYGVKRVLPFTGIGATSQNLFSVQHQTVIQHINDLTRMDIINYSMVMSYIPLLDQLLNGTPQFEFNRMGGKLFLEVRESRLAVGRWIILECYAILDPEQNPLVWNNLWLREFTTALFKRQWGSNMKKYQGVQLPGGVTLDGKTIFDEAVKEVEDLKQQLINEGGVLQMVLG